MTTSTKHALIVGGSAGIGLGVALQLAPLVAKLTICSRSCPPDLLPSIKARNPDVDVVHERLDVSLLHEVRKFTVKHAETDFDWIVLTAGILHSGGHVETAEGLGDIVSSMYYGRFMLLHDLLPSLNRPGVRVVNVLGAGQARSSPALDNLDLNQPLPFRDGVSYLKLYSDIMVQVLSERAPRACFVHMYPGWVDTGLVDKSMGFLRLPLRWVSALFAMTIDQCGENVTEALTNLHFSTGWKLVDEHAQEVPETKFQTEELKHAVYQHTLEIIERVMAS